MATTKNELYERLEAVNLDYVPIVSEDRHIPRKEQAAKARALFKQLGIKGISVTTPNYSMASVCDVRIPKQDHPESTDWTRHDYATCELCQGHATARRKVEAILSKAFPKHDDRSDSMTDYFDSCWSFH